MRSSDAAPGLGERFEQITAEAVRPATLPAASTAEVRAVAQQLDAAPPAAQAAGVPLAFAALLAGAYATQVLTANAPPPEPADASSVMLPEEVIAALRGAFSTVQPLSTASVCLFAVNAEAQASARAFSGAEAAADDAAAPSAASIAAAGTALACVGFAYLGPAAAAYPAQNVVNACVAVGVARVLQLPALGALLAALGGLALYDGFGTLIFSAAAADAASSVADGLPPPSVMESVAQAKIGAAAGGGLSWQPGLLTVRLQGRLTDALGLGDVVAPSLLAGWCRRYDLRTQAAADTLSDGDESGGGEGEDAGGNGGGYLGAALGGYAFGCVLLEVVPSELSRAALLWLVPSVIAAVLFRLVEQKQLASAFGVAPGAPKTSEAE